MKTLLTAAALALAIPAGAALADTHCDVPTANMQSWESLIQLTKDFGWSISKMELDDGCYELNVIDQGGNHLEMIVDPETLEVIDGKVERWSDGTKPEKNEVIPPGLRGPVVAEPFQSGACLQIGDREGRPTHTSKG